MPAQGCALEPGLAWHDRQRHGSRSTACSSQRLLIGHHSIPALQLGCACCLACSQAYHPCQMPCMELRIRWSPCCDTCPRHKSELDSTLLEEVMMAIVRRPSDGRR